MGLFVYDFDMTIDWNDAVRCARRETLNAMLERERHMTALQSRQPSRRDVRRSSTMINGNGMAGTSGRDRASSIKIQAMTTTPFNAASMSSGSSEHPERRGSHRLRRTSDDGGPVHHHHGLGSSAKLNELEERNMLLNHQVLNPSVNNAILHGSNVNVINHLNSHRSESNNSSRQGSISVAPGASSQKSNAAAGGGPSIMRISRRDSRNDLKGNEGITKQSFSAAGMLNRAPSMNFNTLSRQQSQHMGGVLGGRRKTSFIVGHGSHDNLGMALVDGDDKTPTAADGSKNPVFLIPRYSEEIWDDDPDLVEARHLISDSFRQQWDKGESFSYSTRTLSYSTHTLNMTSHYVPLHNSHHRISIINFTTTNPGRMI